MQVAARVRTEDGEEQWILAEVYSYNSHNHRYKYVYCIHIPLYVHGNHADTALMTLMKKVIMSKGYLSKTRPLCPITM